MYIYSNPHLAVHNKHITSPNPVPLFISRPIYHSLFYRTSMIPIHFSRSPCLRTLNIKVCLIPNRCMFLHRYTIKSIWHINLLIKVQSRCPMCIEPKEWHAMAHIRLLITNPAVHRIILKSRIHHHQQGDIQVGDTVCQAISLIIKRLAGTQQFISGSSPDFFIL